MKLNINKIFIDLFALMNLKVIGLSLAFITSIALARVLGASEYGQYSVVMALFLIIEPIAGGGFSSLIIKELANSATSFRIKQQQLLEFLSVTILLSITVAFLLALSLLVIGFSEVSIAFMALIVIPGSMAFQTASGALAGQHLVKISQFLSQVLKPSLFLILLILSYYLNQATATANFALFFMGLSGWLSMLMALKLSPVKLIFNVACKLNFARLLELLKISMPFALITSLQYFQTRIDVVCIGWLLEDIDAGHFQVAARSAQLLSIPAGLIGSILAPKFSRMFNANEITELRKSFWHAQMVCALVSLLFFVFMYYFGESILIGLYGKVYYPALEPYNVLLIAQGLISFIVLPTTLMIMTNHQADLVKMLLVTATLNLLGNYLLIPLYGIVGAAIATSFVGIFTLFWVFILAYKSGLLTKK